MTTEHDSDPRTTVTAPAPRAREVRVSSLAQRRPESASLFPGPPPQPGRVAAAVSDLVAVVSGFASATVVTYLFTRSWARAVVIGAAMAACSIVHVIAVRRRRGRSS